MGRDAHIPNRHAGVLRARVQKCRRAGGDQQHEQQVAAGPGVALLRKGQSGLDQQRIRQQGEQAARVAGGVEEVAMRYRGH